MMCSQKPKLTVSEDGKHITVIDPFFGVSHTFELVDHIPLGYSIWNIGENMAEGYLPLCRLAAVQPFPGGRRIEVDTLKAIKCEGAQVILKTAGLGAETPEEMERYIEKNKNNPRRQYEVEKMKAALPYMRKLKWN